MSVVFVITRAEPDAAVATRGSGRRIVGDHEAYRERAMSAAQAVQAEAALPNETAITPPDHFDEPPPPADPPPDALRRRFANVVPTGGTWAVLIGIDDYPGSRHDLRSAVADVGDVNEALTRLGVAADHRLVITNRQASASTIKLAAEWLVAHASPEATAVFFYAGHVRKLGATTEAMVAADGATVTDAELGNRLLRLKAKRAWIGIAACYGGGFVEALAPGRVLTAAAPANKLAYENSAFGRSYLVQFMVRDYMLGGRSPETVEAAFDYATSVIARDFPGREPFQVDRDPDVPLSLRPVASGGVAPASSPRPTTTTTRPPAQPRPTSTTTTMPSCGVPNPLLGCRQT